MTTEVEDRIHQRLYDLQVAQQTLDPGISNHLREIHNMLKENPEITSLLSDEEISTYIAARRGMVGEMMAPVAKAAAKKSVASKAAKLNVDDI